MKLMIGNTRNVPPLDREALLAANQKLLSSKTASDKVQGQIGEMLMMVAAEDEAERLAEVAAREVRKADNNARFFMTEAYSYYCAPLIDFVGEQFDKFVDLYFDSKVFDDEELKRVLNLTWRILSDNHVEFNENASNKAFYQAYRMHCMNYLRQRYNKLVTRLTSIYRESGLKRCRLAAMMTAMNAVAVMSDTGKDQIGDQIRRHYGTDVSIDEYSMVKVRRMFDHIIRKLELKFLTKLKPRVDEYFEEFYTEIYVKSLVSYGLEMTKDDFGKESYDARLHAIDVFGDGLFS